MNVISYLKLKYIEHSNNEAVFTECCKAYSIVVVKLLKSNHFFVGFDSPVHIFHLYYTSIKSGAAYLNTNIKDLCDKLTKVNISNFSLSHL